MALDPRWESAGLPTTVPGSVLQTTVVPFMTGADCFVAPFCTLHTTYIKEVTKKLLKALPQSENLPPRWRPTN